MLNCERLTLGTKAFRLADISFAVERGEYAVLMGQSGCGKTTLVEAICGLRPLESGTIRLGGVDITHAPVATRGIGYVPQDGAIFPRMTVRDNLAFALMVKKTPQREIDATVEPLAERMGIAHLLSRRATQLSGGETQRVALGRALAASPSILLLDEPLSALDEDSRDDLVALLKQLHQERGITALHVTHSKSEAQRLGDKVLVLATGRILTNPPAQSLDQPTDAVPAPESTHPRPAKSVESLGGDYSLKRLLPFPRLTSEQE